MRTKQLQDFIRSGGWAWPGGYPCALLMGDGESIDSRAARENYRLIRETMKDGDITDDWFPVAVFVNWEDDMLFCAHSGRRIQSAFWKRGRMALMAAIYGDRHAE